MVLAFLVADVFEEGGLVFHEVQRRGMRGMALVHAATAVLVAAAALFVSLMVALMAATVADVALALLLLVLLHGTAAAAHGALALDDFPGAQHQSLGQEFRGQVLDTDAFVLGAELKALAQGFGHIQVQGRRSSRMVRSAVGRACVCVRFRGFVVVDEIFLVGHGFLVVSV